MRISTTIFFLEAVWVVTFANIKGWGSTKSPLHPRPLSDIKLVKKVLTQQLFVLQAFCGLVEFISN